MRFIASAHATKQYAARILDVDKPTLQQLVRARDLMLAEFSENSRTTARRNDGSKVIVSETGTHACVDVDNELITIYTPGLPVVGCGCEKCRSARDKSKHTKIIPRRRRREY